MARWLFEALSRWQSSPPNSDRFASWRCCLSNDLAGSGRGQKWLTSANVTMPTKTGTFEFACLIPGHYQAGMVGMIVVE